MLFWFAIAIAQPISASPPERIDLTIPQPCRSEASSDEVVVCANRNGESPYRLQQSSQKEGIPKAEVSLAEGVSVAGETEQADIGGMPSNRVMLRLKVKF